MFMWQNFSGAACISECFEWLLDSGLMLHSDYYSPTLFAAIGISDTSLYTGIYGLVKGGSAFAL